MRVLFPLALSLFLAPSALARQAQKLPPSQHSVDSTFVTSLDLHATFHNVGVQVDYRGDANGNGAATLEADIGGSGFKPVHRLSRSGTKRFIGTVFDVAPGTSVAVRVTVTDPDGVAHAVQTGSITTRDMAIPVGFGADIHVSTSGDDTTGNGTQASPFATIQHAINLSSPGTTIRLHSGTYHESVLIDAGPTGTPSAPLTITNAGDGPVVLDGTSVPLDDPAAWSPASGNMWTASLDDTYYIGIDGVRLWRYDTLAQLRTLAYGTAGGFFVDTAADKVYMRLPGDAAPTGHQIRVSVRPHAFLLSHTSDVVFDGLAFRNFNQGPHSSSISLTGQTERAWIVNSTFEESETGVRLEGFVEDTVVMNNEFSDAGVNAFDWEKVKEFQWWLEHGALYVTNDEYSGRGTIFCNNFVHDYFDGVKIVGNQHRSYASNCDIEDNVFVHLSDDGVETDGYTSNVRIMRNRFERLLSGVSVAPAKSGPAYIIRNQMVDLQNVALTQYETMAVKFNFDGTPSGEIFVYHNTGQTFEPGQAAFSVSNDSNWQNLVLRNNIWDGTLWATYYHIDNVLPMDQDFDLLHSGSLALVLYQGLEYATLAGYTLATGLNPSGIEGDPLFVDAANGDFRLKASSPAVDAAKVIAGINDTGFNGAGPDLGALER